MRISLKSFIVPSIPLAIILVGSCYVLWGITFLSGHYGLIPSQNTVIENLLLTLFPPNTVLSNIVSVAFTLLNAFLIAQINNRFTIVKTRTFLPIFIFILLMGSWTETHNMNGSHISLTLFIFALFQFLDMYRNLKATENAFLGSFFIGVASLIINPLIFLIPVFWVGFIIFQSFSLRTVFATILGVLAPWVLYLSSLYLLNQQVEFSMILSTNFSLTFGELNLEIHRIIYISVVILILIISIFGMFSITNSDAIRTRNNLNFLLLLLVSTLVLAIIFRSQLTSFLPIIALLYAMLISHPFTLKSNKFFSILFIVFLVSNIFFVIYNILLVR